MASQKERFDILRRYYNDETARRIQAGRSAAAGGFMERLHRIECNRLPAVPRRVARERHLAHCLMHKINSHRRAGATYVPLSVDDYAVILGHIRSHPHTPAHRLVTFWNKRVGRMVLAKRLGRSYSNHGENIGLVEGPLATFVQSWSMTRDSPPALRWAFGDDTQIIYRRDGTEVRMDGYSQYGENGSPRVQLLAHNSRSSLRPMLNIDMVMAQAMGLRVVAVADWVTDARAARADGFASWNDTDVLSSTGTKTVAFWPDSIDDVNAHLSANYASYITGSERCEIHSYHSSSEVLVGEAPAQTGRLTLGLEWEVGATHSLTAQEYIHNRSSLMGIDWGNDRVVSAQQTVSAFRRAAGRASYVHAENDSTVDYGYELVFAYRSLERHRELFAAAMALNDESPWLSTLRSTSSCGIHVHVGRSLGSDEALTPQQITALANLVHFSENRKYIEGMARRSIKNHSHLCLPGTANGTVGISEGGLHSSLKRHYSVVNARKETVEIRMFASTINPEVALEALEIAESMTEYVREASVSSGRYFYLDADVIGWQGYSAYLSAHADRWPLAAARSAELVIKEAIEAEAARLQGEEADALLRELLGNNTADQVNPEYV